MASVTSGIQDASSLAAVGNGGAKWSLEKRKDLRDQRGSPAQEGQARVRGLQVYSRMRGYK